MALYQFHRVLIAAAILFDFCLTFWAIRQWQDTGDPLQIVLAVGSSVVTIGLIAYLVYFNRSLVVIQQLLARQRPMPIEQHRGL